MFDPIYKSYETLPDYPERILQPSNPSNKMLALIPVFRDPYIDAQNMPVFIKSAAYSRASCLKNTDALARGVEVKLYVQHGVDLFHAEAFKANHIDMETDVLLFSETPPGIGNHRWGRLGKKTRSYYHFSLAKYKRIVCFDADIWFLDHQRLFKQLERLPENMIAYPELNLVEVSKIKHRLRNFVSQNGLAIDTIFERAELVDLPEHLLKPIGYFWTHPAESLLMDMAHYDLVSWISDHSKYLGDDETIIAFASHKFGYPLHALNEVADVKFARVRDVMLGKSTDAHIAHGKAPYEQDDAFNDFLLSL